MSEGDGASERGGDEGRIRERCMYVCMYGWKKVIKGGRMSEGDGASDGLMDVWSDEWMYGWME